MFHLPARPFSNDYLMLVDSLRMVACIGAAAVFGLYLGQVFTNKRLDWRDRAKSIGLCLLTVIVFFTEVGRLGHKVTWRLEITVPALLLLIWGNGPRSDRPFHMVGK